MKSSRWRLVRAAVVLATVSAPLLQMPVAKADTVTATLARRIDASTWFPQSPDPSGVAFIPGSDAMMYADSEVDETTGAGYHGVNVWVRTRTTDADIRTFTTLAYTNEPTGLAYDPAGGRLFISSDSGEKLFVLLPGSDGLVGTADDPRTTILLTAYGVTDAEDVAFNTQNGHAYIGGGIAHAVFDIDPVDGVFGNGNDTVTSFDVGVYGGKDEEGIGYDPVRNTLLVMDRATKRIYETTTSGTLVRTINASGISGLQNPSDVEVAPASNGSGTRNYWITDRTVDNGTNASENDGLVWEVTIGGATDAAPQVTLTAPAQGATVSGTSVPLSASASDDHGVSKVEWFLDGGATAIATDTTAGDGFTGTWNSTTASNASHTITARATDTIGQTANDTHTVTVSNGDSVPTVTLTAPSQGATVTGTSVPLSANASDDKGVSKVEWFLDGGATAIATDTTAGDGWTGTWNSTTASNASHTITARATDTIGQTANDSHTVTVSNGGGGGTSSILNIPVATSSDDAEQKQNTNMVLNSTDLDLMTDSSWIHSAVGLRFTGVGLPANATITSAYVQFTADESWAVSSTLEVAGQKAANPLTFTTATSNITSRPLTTARAAWSSPGWTVVGARTADQRTPDLSAIVREIIGQSGWAPGNAVVITITGSGRLVAKAFDGTAAADVPVLHVEYTTSGGTDAAPSVTLTAPTQGATVAGTAVPLAATASDDVGVSKVEWFLDGGATAIATDSTAGDGWTGTWNSTGASEGAHTVTARATDTSGQTANDTHNVTVDNIDGPPTVTLTAPAQGATVSGASVALSATASDDRGVSKVEWFLDAGSTPIATDTTASDGWTGTWDSRTTTNAGHTITAKVTDSGTQTATDAHTVTVANAGAPSVTLTAPAQLATVSGNAVALAATATDDVGVVKVEWFLDAGSTPIATDTTSGDGWTGTWNSIGVAEGSHTITARATDTSSLTANDTHTVTVDNIDDPPTVTLTAPAQGAVVKGSAVPVSATAGDDKGVSKVEWFLDGAATPFATDTTSADGWTGTWDATGAGEGSHTIAARATDTIGQTTADAHSVVVDLTAPAVGISSPAESASVSGTVTVTASVSDASTVTSVQFFRDGVSLGTDTNAGNGWSVSWDTTGVGNGAHVLTATATDVVGNAGTSPDRHVSVANTLAIDVTITASSDDVEEKSNTNMILNSTDLDMMTDNSAVYPGVGLRFPAVTLPAGATITNAYVQFTADEAWNVASTLRINGQLAADPGTFTSAKNNLLSRVKTSASVGWSCPGWTVKGARGDLQRTPNLTPILTELAANGWTSGNAVVFIITGDPGGRLVARAADSSAGGAPTLHIDYTI